MVLLPIVKTGDPRSLNNKPLELHATRLCDRHASLTDKVRSKKNGGLTSLRQDAISSHRDSSDGNSSIYTG